MASSSRKASSFICTSSPRVTSAISTFRSLIGGCIVLGRGVDMLFVVLQSFLVPLSLVQQKVLPPSMHNVLDGVSVHDHHTLLWFDHSVSWHCFSSHHMPVIICFIPQATRKSEGGPPCSSMPLGARCGLLPCLVRC